MGESVFSEIVERLEIEDAVAKLPSVPEALTLSVVVPTYRRPQNLACLLAALEKQVTGNSRYSVVVVNDGSHDAEYQRVLDRYGYFVEYHALPENRGPALARNEAVRRAKGAFLVFTDDDCEPPAHWLDRLAAILDASPYLVVVGGPTKMDPSRHRKALARFLEHMQLLPRPLYQRGDLYCLPTANVAVRKDWFEAIGGFDHRFCYAAGEDANLTFRLRHFGASMIVVGEWYTGHDLNFTFRELLQRYYRYGFGNMQHALLSDDPTDQGLFEYTSLGEIIWYERQAPARRADSLQAVESRFERWLFSGLFYLTRICYQRGALHARREMAKWYPELARS